MSYPNKNFEQKLDAIIDLLILNIRLLEMLVDGAIERDPELRWNTLSDISQERNRVRGNLSRMS